MVERKDIPGPDRNLISKVSLTRDFLGNRDHQRDLGQEYGDVYFEATLLTTAVHVTSRDLAMQVFRDSDTYTLIPMINMGVFPWLTATVEDFMHPDEEIKGRNLLNTEVSDKWRRFRDHARDVLSGVRIGAAIPEIERITDEVIDEWSEGQTIDINKAMSTITARTMSVLLLGAGDQVEPITDQEMGIMFASLDNILAYLGLTMMLGAQNKATPPALLALTGQYKKYLDNALRIAETAEGIFRRVVRHEDGSDFISLGVKHGLTEAEIQSQLNVLLQAGFETTKTSALWALVYASEYPEWHDRLHEEVHKVFPSGQITIEGLAELPMMDAFLNEVFRLDTPVPNVSRYTTRDTMLGGVAIPKDTMVVIEIDAIHRSMQLRDDPEIFDPIPWLEKSKSANELVPFANTPGNKKSCVGMNLAKVELKTLFAKLLLRNVQLQVLPVENEDVYAAKRGLVHGPKANKAVVHLAQ